MLTWGHAEPKKSRVFKGDRDLKLRIQIYEWSATKGSLKENLAGLGKRIIKEGIKSSNQEKRTDKNNMELKILE